MKPHSKTTHRDFWGGKRLMNKRWTKHRGKVGQVTKLEDVIPQV